MVPVLLDCAAGDDADLAELNGVVDLGPGQLLVTVLGPRSATHRRVPWELTFGLWMLAQLRGPPEVSQAFSLRARRRDRRGTARVPLARCGAPEYGVGSPLLEHN